MPEVEIEETEVNKPNGNPLDDIFASPGSSGAIDHFMGGVQEVCPEGQKWDKDTQTCIPIKIDESEEEDPFKNFFLEGTVFQDDLGPDASNLHVGEFYITPTNEVLDILDELLPERTDKTSLRNTSRSTSGVIEQNIADITRAQGQLNSIMDPRYTILAKSKLELEKALKPTIEKEKEDLLIEKTQGAGALKMVGQNIELTSHYILKNILRIPTAINEVIATATMSDKELEILNSLPPNQREAMVNLYGPSPTWGEFSQYLLGLRDEAIKDIDELNKDIYQFETGVGADFATAWKNKDFEAFWNASVRTSVTSLGQLPFLVEAMTLPGIATIVFQEAAGASGDKQEEAWEAWEKNAYGGYK